MDVICRHCPLEGVRGLIYLALQLIFIVFIAKENMTLNLNSLNTWSQGIWRWSKKVEKTHRVNTRPIRISFEFHPNSIHISLTISFFHRWPFHDFTSDSMLTSRQRTERRHICLLIEGQMVLKEGFQSDCSNSSHSSFPLWQNVRD